jgi:vacuolar-type H+-ATPase subunit D/Vma8
MMEMMERKQRDMKEEQKDMRVQLKLNEQQLEEMRRNCRTLEDEKMALMVSNLTHEKEIAQLREQIQAVLAKTYDKLLTSFHRVLLLDESLRRQKRDSHQT